MTFERLLQSLDRQIHQQYERRPSEKQIGEQHGNAEHGRTDVKRGKYREIEQDDTEQKDANQPLPATSTPAAFFALFTFNISARWGSGLLQIERRCNENVRYLFPPRLCCQPSLPLIWAELLQPTLVSRELE